MIFDIDWDNIFFLQPSYEFDEYDINWRQNWKKLLTKRKVFRTHLSICQRHYIRGLLSKSSFE